MALELYSPGPNHLQVLVIPAEEKPVFLTSIETIEVKPKPIARSKEPISAEERISHHIANSSGMRYDPSTNRYQPDMARIPMMETWWGSSSAWELRAVDGLAGYHVFFTDAKKGLTPHRWGNKMSGRCIHGDFLLVQVAQEKDRNGRWHYENIDDDIGQYGRLLWNCLELLKNRDPRM